MPLARTSTISSSFSTFKQAWLITPWRISCQRVTHWKNNYAYNQFIDAYEINGYFLLYVDKVSGLVITKRAMETQDIENFRTILKNAYGKKFQIRGRK